MEAKNCLVVSRHKLLPAQEQDIREICGDDNFVQVSEIPTDLKQLQNFVEPFYKIIGTFPTNLIDPLTKTGKEVYIFEMRNLGTYSNPEEAKKVADQYPDFAVVLQGNKPGEPSRVVFYEGISRVKRVVIEKEKVITHDDPLSSYLSQTS